MATPLVHACVGVVLVAVPLISLKRHFNLPTSRILVGSAFFACLPDFDLLYSYLLTGDATRLHFKHTHTLIFAVLTGLAMWWLTNARLALTATLLVLSHVLVDGLTGPELGLNSTPGVPALLPFTRLPVSFPVTLFHGVDHSDWLNHHNMINAAYDILLYGPILALTCWLMVRKKAH